MDYNRSRSGNVLEPEIPEQNNNWNEKGVNGFSYRIEDTSYQHLRSGSLKGLIGFSDEDVVELLGEEHGLDYHNLGVENIEYGNGWALIEFD